MALSDLSSPSSGSRASILLQLGIKDSVSVALATPECCKSLLSNVEKMIKDESCIFSHAVGSHGGGFFIMSLCQKILI